MARVILLTGFEPFGGERTNPSWEVASWLDGKEIGGATIHTLELPVSCRRASKIVASAIASIHPTYLGNSDVRFINNKKKVFGKIGE